jgi:hypothetical protein
MQVMAAALVIGALPAASFADGTADTTPKHSVAPRPENGPGQDSRPGQMPGAGQDNQPPTNQSQPPLNCWKPPRKNDPDHPLPPC